MVSSQGSEHNVKHKASTGLSHRSKPPIEPWGVRRGAHVERPWSIRKGDTAVRAWIPGPRNPPNEPWDFRSSPPYEHWSARWSLTWIRVSAHAKLPTEPAPGWGSDRHETPWNKYQSKKKLCSLYTDTEGRKLPITIPWVGASGVAQWTRGLSPAQFGMITMPNYITYQYDITYTNMA